MIDLSKFKHNTPIQIRFADTDMMRHLNNANYHTYIESARIKYFNDIVRVPVDWVQQGMILANVRMDYLKPIFFRDEISVFTRCSKIGTKSFELEYAICRNNKGIEQEICASASTVLVCFDYMKNETIAIPAEWKKMLEEFEK